MINCTRTRINTSAIQRKLLCCHTPRHTGPTNIAGVNTWILEFIRTSKELKKTNQTYRHLWIQVILYMCYYFFQVQTK